MARFSKESMVGALEKKVERHEQKYGFQRSNGTAQLSGELATLEATVAYGEYRAYLSLLEGINDGSLIRNESY